MSTFNIQTTESISTGNSALSGVSAGDYIVTQGYYAPNDGGAATFEVKAILPNTTIDGIFKHSIYNAANLFAELVIDNHTVHATQIGAVSGAVIPTDDFGANYMNAIHTANPTYAATLLKNDPIFMAAAANENVHKLTLSRGCVYGISFLPVIDRNCFTLEGNDATLLQLDYGTDSDHVFDSAGDTPLIGIGNAQNIRVRNLKLIYVYDSYFTAAIQAVHSQSVQLEHLDILSLGNAIMSNDVSTVFAVRHSSLRSSLSAISLYSSAKTMLSYLCIETPDDGIIVRDPVGECFADHITIRNARYAFYLHNSNGNASIQNVYIRNATYAIHMAHSSKVFVQNLFAENIEKAFTGQRCENVSYVNCKFSGKDPEEGEPATDAAFANPTKFKDFVFKDCVFDFATNWFSFTSSNAESNYLFCGCCFRARSLTEQRPCPGIITGSGIEVSFLDCLFDILQFPLNDSNGAPLAESSIFRFSGSVSYPIKWNLDDCEFRYKNPDEWTANAPVWINAQENTNGKRYVSMTNCTLNGFRWTMRFYTTTGGTNNIDPAQTGYPDDTDVVAAASALTAKLRFLSKDNLYRFSTIPTGFATTYHKKAAEYGYTQ